MTRSIPSPKVHIEKKKYQMSEEGVEECDTEYQFPFDPKWELDRERLRIHSLLGEGQFGRVMYATLDCGGGDGEGSGGAQVPVAVKERGMTKLFYANCNEVGNVIGVYHVFVNSKLARWET